MISAKTRYKCQELWLYTRRYTRNQVLYKYKAILLHDSTYCIVLETVFPGIKAQMVTKVSYLSQFLPPPKSFHMPILLNFQKKKNTLPTLPPPSLFIFLLGPLRITRAPLFLLMTRSFGKWQWCPSWTLWLAWVEWEQSGHGSSFILWLLYLGRGLLAVSHSNGMQW